MHIFVTAVLPITGEFKELCNSPPPLVVHSAVLLHSAFSLLQLGGTEIFAITSTAAPGWVEIAAMAASMSDFDSQF